jgi:hypothetical protein
MKYTSGKPVEVFANEIRALANRINSIEEVRAKKKNASPALVGEHDMIAVLISSLPNEYDTEVTLIEREEENTFEKAVELIRNREQRLRTISNEGTANSVQGATNGRPKLPPCDVCGKNGHSSAKCFKNPNRRGAGRGGNRGRGRGRSRNDAQVTEMAEIPVMHLPGENHESNEEYDVENLWGRKDDKILLAVPPEERLEIIIDSGCSRHVCGATFKPYLSEWRTGPEVRVRVADGNKHTSNTYGTLQAMVETANGVQEMTIRDVLYVEPIHSMLVSVSMLCSNGYKVNFEENRCTLQDPKGNALEALKKARDQLF